MALIESELLATIERCEHQSESGACAWCESSRASRASTRRADRAAASLRASMRRAESERNLLAGYRLLDGESVRTIERVSESIGRSFGIDPAECVERTLDRVATYIGSIEVEKAHVLLLDRTHLSALARRIARRIATRASTGRGSMPRLRVGAHSLECEPSGCAPGCDASMLDAFVRRVVVRVERPYCETIDRTLTASERGALVRTLDYERVEGAPDYPRWLDAFGESAPNVGDAHPFGHRAPGVPERDAPSTRRASMREGAAWVLPESEHRAWVLALDSIQATGRIDWEAMISTVEIETGKRLHRTTLYRRVRHACETLARIDRDALAIDRSSESDALLDGESVRIESVLRHACSIECEHGRGISLMHSHRAIGRPGECVEHAPGEHDVSCIERMVQVSPGLPVDGRIQCVEHAPGECNRECAARIARIARIERVSQVTTRTEYLQAIE